MDEPAPSEVNRFEAIREHSGAGTLASAPKVECVELAVHIGLNRPFEWRSQDRSHG
jgi:hypothetical protein